LGGRLLENDDPTFVDWINVLFHGRRKTNQDRYVNEGCQGPWARLTTST
jgi:hypothetical protein